MGLTYIQASVANPARPERRVRLKFLVDSGAFYSVVPASVLRRLGIKPGKTKTFILADGTEVKRALGQALFRVNGDEGASPVIFGEKSDSVLFGSVSLEALGLFLDPLKRELRPLPLLLAPHRSSARNNAGDIPVGAACPGRPQGSPLLNNKTRTKFTFAGHNRLSA